MTGYDDPGVIPRLTRDLFSRISQSAEPIKVWVSYLEIYNERIRDLLRPSDAEEENLNIFEHQKLGVVVPDATVTPVATIEDVNRLMEYGLSKRASAATSMNATSSRSHAIYTLHIETSTSISKINLVDLAGSERVSKSNARGDTQREAGMINQSLTNLGIVIKGLSEKQDFVPFRNSKLTFLLKDSLSGNSRTYMIAAISPAGSEMEETISTLRFASNVKKIVTNPQVNYGTHEDLVDGLKAEISLLKSQLAASKDKSGSTVNENLSGTMKVKSAVLKMLSASFHRKANERRVSLEANHDPYLLNVSEDPLAAGIVTFSVPAGKVWKIGSDPHVDDLVIKEDSIYPSMASIENKEGVLYVTKLAFFADALVSVNGTPVSTEDTILAPGDTLSLSTNAVFRLVVPVQSPTLARKPDPSPDSFTEIEYLVKSYLRPPLVPVETVHQTLTEARALCTKVDTVNAGGHRSVKYAVRLLLPSASTPDPKLLVIELVEGAAVVERWTVERFTEWMDKHHVAASHLIEDDNRDDDDDDEDEPIEASKDDLHVVSSELVESFSISPKSPDSPSPVELEPMLTSIRSQMESIERKQRELQQLSRRTASIIDQLRQQST